VPWFISPTSNPPVTTSPPKSRPPSQSKTDRDSFIVLRYLDDRFSSGIEDVESQIVEPILFPTKSNGLQQDLPRESIMNRPAWARKGTSRRGLDTPFGRKTEDTEDTASTDTKVESPNHIKFAAPQPLIAQARRGVDPPFARKVDIPNVPPAVHIANTQTLEVPHFDTPIQRKLTVGPAFSYRMGNLDAPIPLPKLSEWIRADSPPRNFPQRT